MSAKKTAPKVLPILKNDPWLEPYADAITGRHNDAIRTEKRITSSCKTLKDFANAYKYFGLHRLDDGKWVFREWAPNATAITLVGDFSNWERNPKFSLKKLDNGVWEGVFPKTALRNGQNYKMAVDWEGGSGERIPAYADRVVQDPTTHIFSAQVWAPKTSYKWQVEDFVPDTKPLLIYECHIGMAQQEEGVGTYDEFREKVLPRIAADGYNAIQIMAIQEHPYYGSFGYHVSNFYAPSSRFGTPDELRRLIDAAHQERIAVIMDIVHSHAVKNENEGLGRLDGSYDLYFHGDHRREHPAWDSLCFDYGKDEVMHFLLSNCKYWLEEFKFDGFRFDGVTSMLYYNHGLGQAFGGYGDYYNGGQDTDAITYLTLANKLIHEVNPHAITIAEEMSGMPGLAMPIREGGMGFDYRMAMGIPDYWIKMIKDRKDEEWSMGDMWYTLINRRYGEPNIAYAESHDQALVGDKTIAFRLMDAEMYTHMACDMPSVIIDRGMALHKMIRLATLAAGGEGWLCFMGNEFGHPEWIDFPREGNGNSYLHCRRQWSLADNKLLRYHLLLAFDKAMLSLAQEVDLLASAPARPLNMDEKNRVMAFERAGLIFVFNWNGEQALPDYLLSAPAHGEWRVALDSDSPRFGGLGRQDTTVRHFTDKNQQLSLYLLPRTVTVLRRGETGHHRG